MKESINRNKSGVAMTTAVVLGLLVIVGLWYWGFIPWTTLDANLTNREDVTAQFSEMKALIADMGNDQAKASGKLSSNQTVMSEMLQSLATKTASNNAVNRKVMSDLSFEMASNNIAIRAQIPEIVKKEVSKAMEPFQWLLTNPQTVVTQQIVTTPQPVVAVTQITQPVVYTNNNTTVVNLPSPPPQPQPQLVVLNKNTVVIGLPSQLSQQPAMTKPPYWLRDLW